MKRGLRARERVSEAARSRGLRRALVGLSLAMLFGACASTETGNPPLQESGWVTEGFSAFPAPGDPQMPQIVLMGVVTEAVAPDATVRVIPLGPLTTPVTVPIVDGTFEITLPDTGAIDLRLHIDGPLGRRPPVDLRLAGGVTTLPDPVTDLAPSCLSGWPLVQADASGRARFVVENHCESAITIDGVALRGLATISPEETVALDVDGSRAFTVTLDDAVPGDGEEVIRFSDSVGESPAYVTVYR